MNNNYNIKPLQEILKYINAPNHPIKIDPYTMAKIYRGTNNLCYLIPAVGIKGIEASDLAILDSILASKKIPIDETNPNIFQRNIEAIMGIRENGSSIIALFSKENLLEIDTLNLSLDYNRLNKIVNNTKGKVRYEKFFFPIGVLLGEKLRREKKTKWYLEKRYGYNPYFEPFLINETGTTKYDPWYFLSRGLLSSAPFDFMQEYLKIRTVDR